METTPQQALIPLEQAITLFHGHEILLVRLSDDRVAATLNSLCAMLGIHQKSQARRIRRNKALAQYLLLIPLKTAGGSQRMDILIAEAIHDWLLGVQVEQVALEKRPLVLALQIEAVAVFYRRFFDEQTVKRAPEAQVESPVRSIRQETDATSDSLWERLFDVLHDMQQQEERKDKRLNQRLGGFEEWLTSLDRRVAAVSPASAAESKWLPGLSQAHLSDLQALFRSLEQTTGCLALQLEQELVETFGTPTINAIPDEQWQDVLAWCIWRAQQPR